MKKIIVLIVVLLIGFSFINNVYAEDFIPSIESSATENLVVGDTFVVEYYFGNGSMNVNFKLDFDTSVYQLNDVSISNFHEYTRNGNEFSIKQKSFDNSSAFLKLEFKIIGYSTDNYISFIEQRASSDGSNYSAGSDYDLYIDIMSSETYLKNLIITGGTLTTDFDADKTEYELILDEYAEIINVFAVPGNGDIKVTGDIGDLSIDTEKIEIVTTAMDGTKKVYTINVTKSIDDIDSSLLTKLSLSSGYINFNKNTFNYNVIVDYNIENIELYYLQESHLSSVKINKSSTLNVGNNEIEIVVTSESGNKSTYTINVKRLDEGESGTLSSNNYLSNLTIEGYEIQFDKNLYEYKILVPEDILNITYQTEQDGANVSIQGNENLTIDSVVSIVVTAENGNNVTYKISFINEQIVVETPEEESSIMIFIIIGIVIALLITAIVIFIIIKRRKSYIISDSNNIITNPSVTLNNQDDNIETL